MNTTENETVTTADPVIAWLEQIREFEGSQPLSRELARAAIARLAATTDLLQALREVAGDYRYLNIERGVEECVHCCADLATDGDVAAEHEPECTMRFVFDALARAGAAVSAGRQE